ncbi:hypothetical protein [Streptomyces sp. NPDC002671]
MECGLSGEGLQEAGDADGGEGAADEFPVLTGHLATILPATVDHDVYYGALRQLIHAADPAHT